MLDDLKTPLDLEGRDLGPVTVPVTADRVAFYADTTGDDADRWVDEAPPGFGSVLLFAVADLFLYHPKVVPFTATLLHLDQSFTYHGAMRTGVDLTVSGTITKVRERRGSYFVTFESSASDGSDTVLSSVSTFVLSDQASEPSDSPHTEPAARASARNDGSQRSASRHDLVRYAAATRDFNPLHWDHEVAVAAGLPGTVVHGLLMYAWMAQAVESASGSTIDHMKVRFRSALHPGEQADIAIEQDGSEVKVTLSRDDTALVTGVATVGSRE